MRVDIPETLEALAIPCPSPTFVWPSKALQSNGALEKKAPYGCPAFIHHAVGGCKLWPPRA